MKKKTLREPWRLSALVAKNSSDGDCHSKVAPGMTNSRKDI